MNIVFFGSDDFAAAHLKALIDSRHEVAACVTQPDKPKGSGWKVSGSPVKQCAGEHKILVLQPTRLRDEVFLITPRLLSTAGNKAFDLPLKQADCSWTSSSFQLYKPNPLMDIGRYCLFS